jgi:CPA2 family monovalent cation:H+ antiporter-2
MALGAFLAGMMLSETEFRHQIEADIRPFRDVLLGLFFITIGMLLNIGELPHIIHWVLFIGLLVVVVKTIATMLLGMLITRVPNGVALRTGLVLAQGGEFGFALLSLALAADIMDNHLSQILLASVIFTMALTPFLIRYNGWAAKHIYARSYGASRDQLEEDIKIDAAGLRDHVIICGFGRIGQNLARVAEQEDRQYFALDYNINLISDARKAGYNVYFGDSTHQSILLAAGIKRAAALIICHDDIGTAEKTLVQVRKLNTELPVLVRTQDETYYERLQKAGATEVVPETLEASLIMASQLLSLMGTPMSRIVRRVQEMRNDNYNALREYFHGDEPIDMDQPEESRKRLTSVTLEPGAFAIGKTLDELALDKAGVTVHTNRRADSRSQKPNPGLQLKQGDVLVLFGTPESLEHAESYLLNG